MIPYSIFTNEGNRPVNEDRVGVAVYGANSYCFVLADGLGGHGSGEKAAQIAVDAVCSVFVENGFSSSFFEKALNYAQDAILAEQTHLNIPSRMKTTIVVLVISDKKAYCAHIGDSRLYFFKGGKMKRRTLDHSVPQALVLSKEIPEKNIRCHPDRNRLLKVMGVGGERADYEEGKPVKLGRNTAFLLCSDGFWEPCEEKTMEETLKQSNSAEQWLEKMKQHILGQSIADQDNFSAIAVFPE